MDDLIGNTAVFTTIYVVKKKSPIVFVSHDMEGDWQFFGKEPLSTRDAMIISLDEILEIDPSVKHVLHIPAGSEAHRSDIHSDWLINKKGGH